MAKQKGGSAFDELIEKLGDDDRNTFTALADRNPFLKEYGLRQDEFSRRQGELTDKVKKLESWEQWENNHWVWDKEDPNIGHTKAELAAMQRAEALEAEKERLAALVEFGGEGEMTFQELEQKFDEFSKTKKFVSQDDVIKERDALYQQAKDLNGYTAYAAGELPYLLMKHKEEFNEILDPKKFLAEANSKNRLDLREFYENEFVRAARDKKVTDGHQAEIERLKAESNAAIDKVKQEAAALADRARGMSPMGSPTDSGESSMSPMQRHILGMGADEKANQEALDKAQVTEGGSIIAALAAKQFLETGKVGRP